MLEHAEILAAAEALRGGEVVAFPTETVYGLGARADEERAVQQIYALKGRPANNPLIAHYANASAAKWDVVMTKLAEQLAAAFWPGPLTMVLEATENTRICLAARAGLATAAVRVPNHPVALSLLNHVDFPVVAPSANRSGRVRPTTAVHVRSEFFGKNFRVLDGGPCRVGVESTIVDVRAGRCRLLRPGGIAVDLLLDIVGEMAVPDAGGSGAVLLAPGMMASHYAPQTRVRLGADDPQPDEALLAFGPNVPEGFGRVVNLSSRGDLAEAARNLYDALRTLDEGGFRAIAVMEIPHHGLGLALNDRLRRAAA